MKHQSHKIKPMRIVNYLLVAVIMIIYLVPLSYVLITAFKTPMDFLREPLSYVFGPTLENFTTAWSKVPLGRYLLNSASYVLIATAASVFFALLASFPISRGYVKFSAALYSFFMLGMFLPDGSISLFQIYLKTGLYDTRLGYILTLINVGGFATMFLSAYIKSIPRELDEAAAMDGCGYFRYCFSVIIPMAKPAIASTSIMLAIPIWNDISKAIIYLSNENLYPVSRGVYAFSSSYSSQWTVMIAAAVIVSIPLFIFYLFAQRYIIDGMSAGAVKM